jgi:Ca-activated chloride channel family protein
MTIQRSTVKHFILTLAACLSLPFWLSPVHAQSPADFTLAVAVDLVELQITVLDENDRHVRGLSREDFQITEDRVEQDVSLFRHDDKPVSLGVIIDNSRSMERKKERVDTAALSFIQHSNPLDETFLIHFDDEVRMALDFTGDLAPIETTLASISPYGQTALFDAILTGIEAMEEGKYEQKAILLVSDGADNASAHAFSEVLEAARLADVAIYSIGILSDSDVGRTARKGLEELSEITGGRSFFPTRVEEIPALTESVALELRELYTVGYSPTNARRDGTWRSVRINVTQPPETPRYQTNYRHGYYAPNN